MIRVSPTVAFTDEDIDLLKRGTGYVGDNDTNGQLADSLRIFVRLAVSDKLNAIQERGEQR